MNYEAERAMNQKRLRMEAEPGHGVVQGNGLPLNYIDNGHQIPYQPYAGAYNTHYPPPDAFAAYGPPPPGGYAPQNLSYAPPAHQNYPHHQSFPPQQPQAQLHMAQTHMVQSYGDVHKAAAAAAAAWGPQPHLLPPAALDAKPPLPEHKPKEIKLEPPDAQKRPHAEADLMSGELEQPKIKIKTDIFKPDDLAPRPEPAIAPPREIPVKPLECAQKPVELQKDDGIPISADGKPVDKPSEASKPDAAVGGDALSAKEPSANADKSQENAKGFSSPESKAGSSPGKSTPGSEQKKRGRPKGSTNKPKPPGTKPPAPAHGPRGPPPPRPAAPPRPRAMGYQYAMRPFRKDFSGIQFRRRWSDDCLDSTHIPNEVYFGDVPVTPEVLHNYYDANAERERLAAHAAHLAAQKAAAAKLAQAKLQARGITQEVTTVDSSSSEDSSGSDEESEDSDEDAPLKKSPATPKAKPAKKPPATPGKRGRPPVPPELRQPGITDMKKFCKAAGIRFDYKKLVEGCTKNKERVAKMMELLTAAGLEGKPSLEACRALKAAKAAKKDQEKQAKKDAKAKHKEDARGPAATATAGDPPRRLTRGATGVKPRQRIVISSDEEDGTPLARRALSKLRSSVRDDSDSD